MSFKPRSKTTFGIPPKIPASEVILDTRSFVRQAPATLRDKPCNTAQQRLWIDITDLDTTNIEKTDDEYNSNMWKNFKFVRPKASAGSLAHSRGISTPKRHKVINLPSHRKPNVDEDPAVRNMIADTYPLKLPKPSKIGGSTYSKFLNEANLREQKRQRIGLQLAKTQGLQDRVLRIRSECRAPPVNIEGEILPPPEFKKYAHKVSVEYIEDETMLEPKPLSYVAQTARPYTGSPSESRAASPWKHGVRGSSNDYQWNERI